MTIDGKTRLERPSGPTGYEEKSRNHIDIDAQESKSSLKTANSEISDRLSLALESSAANLTGQPNAIESLTHAKLVKASTLSEEDAKAMDYLHRFDGEYLVTDSQFERRGNTFRIIDGPLAGYKLIYKGGRNFQLRNEHNESLMIYHGPRRRPRISPSPDEVNQVLIASRVSEKA